MLAQTPHVFSHQHQYPQADPSWLQHQQHRPHSSLVAQQHAQVQAAASAAAAAQQQHYNRIAMTGTAATTAVPQAAGVGGLGEGALLTNSSTMPVMESAISDENRKVFICVAELLDPARRENALMELSKKREQVPELALVIWHSFGIVLRLPQDHFLGV